MISQLDPGLRLLKASSREPLPVNQGFEIQVVSEHHRVTRLTDVKSDI